MLISLSREMEYVVRYPSGRYLKDPKGEFTDLLSEAYGWTSKDAIEVGPGAVGPAVIKRRCEFR